MNISGFVSKMAFLGFGGVAILSGCTQPSGSTQSVLGYDDLVNLNDGSACEFDYNQGETADLNAAQQSDIQKASFEKEFNQAPLKAVLKASAAETVRFLTQGMGVGLFKARSIKAKCRLFDALPRVDAVLHSQWQFSAGGEGALMGLYLPANHSLGNSKPIIIMRDNVIRWVLLHEMMHHLFRLRIQEVGGPADQTLVEEFSKKGWTFKNLASKVKGSGPELNQLAEEIQERHRLFWEFAKRYSLEEVAVEKILLWYYKKEDLMYSPRSYGAEWYIHKSSRDVSDKLREMQASIREIHDAITAETDDARQARLQLRNTMGNIDLELQEIVETYKDSTGLDTKAAESTLAGSKDLKQLKFDLCGRDKEGQEVMHSLGNLRDRVHQVLKKSL